jgi:hypothetical protein
MDEILKAAEVRETPAPKKVKGQYVDNILVAEDAPVANAMGFDIGLGMRQAANGALLPILYMRTEPGVRPKAEVPVELVNVALVNHVLDPVITRALLRADTVDGGLLRHFAATAPTDTLRAFADMLHDAADVREQDDAEQG